MVFGSTTDIPIIGDWNGDGIDTPGVYRSSTGMFYLTDLICNCNGVVNYSILISGTSAGELPLVGDWNGDGIIGLGTFKPSTGVMRLKNTVASGSPDYTFTFGGGSTDVPLAGTWKISTYVGPLFTENPINEKKIPPVENAPTFVPRR